MMKNLCYILLFLSIKSFGCSIFYYIHPSTGQIFVINNEDYYLDTKAYLQIEKHTDNENGRVWLGWENFAQGGINEKGLFFDAAVTPTQVIDSTYSGPNGRNIGDQLLAKCNTVIEAIAFLESNKIALNSSHFFLSDSSGNAAIIEWINKEKIITYITSDRLVATNFLLADTTSGNYPCPRFESIHKNIDTLSLQTDSTTLNEVGQCIGSAVQLPFQTENRTGGTIYTNFYDYQTKEFILVPRLDGSKLIKLDLSQQYFFRKKRKIKF